MSKLFSAVFIGMLLSSCTKEVPAPKPVLDSKFSMLVDGLSWESNQAFNGTNAAAYNAASTVAQGSKFLTALTAQNNAEDYFYFTILYNAKPQVDKAYDFELVSFKQNGKQYAAGPVIGTSGTVMFTSVTDSALSGNFSGKIALIEGVSTVAAYVNITDGSFTEIKYKP